MSSIYQNPQNVQHQGELTNMDGKCLCTFINCTTLVEEVGEAVHVWGQGLYGTSLVQVLSAQCHSEPESALKTVSIKKQNKNELKFKKMFVSQIKSLVKILRRCF